MIPVGYMAKRIVQGTPEWMHALNVTDVYSVSSCVSEEFADYIDVWKHNGYWLFDSPAIIREVAQEKSSDLSDCSLFFYEAYEMEFDEESGRWEPFAPEPSFTTNIVIPQFKRLEGFDLVTFFAGNAPECSPLSCNGLAEELSTNSHCLLATFDEGKQYLEEGRFAGSEHGPYRIFAVYSVDWPSMQ